MFLSNLLRRFRMPKLSMKISMWKTFYIKPNEIGILYHRSDFKKFLQPGTYSYFGRHWQVTTYDLNQPDAKIENLELLLKTHEAELQEHLAIIRTAFDQVALVRSGQNWVSVAPNQLRAGTEAAICASVSSQSRRAAQMTSAPARARRRAIAPFRQRLRPKARNAACHWQGRAG